MRPATTGSSGAARERMRVDRYLSVEAALVVVCGGLTLHLFRAFVPAGQIAPHTCLGSVDECSECFMTNTLHIGLGHVLAHPDSCRIHCFRREVGVLMQCGRQDLAAVLSAFSCNGFACLHMQFFFLIDQASPRGRPCCLSTSGTLLSHNERCVTQCARPLTSVEHTARKQWVWRGTSSWW